MQQALNERFWIVRFTDNYQVVGTTARSVGGGGSRPGDGLGRLNRYIRPHGRLTTPAAAREAQDYAA